MAVNDRGHHCHRMTDSPVAGVAVAGALGDREAEGRLVVRRPARVGARA